MKSIRQLCLAVFMTLALSLSAFAGEIHLPGVRAANEMPATGAAVTADSLMEIAFGFLLEVSSLL